jgi:hypothetical protein
MKPCRKNRKLLAWLALGNLDDKQATVLRDHVATCDGCRCYLDELGKVTASISTAGINTDIVATASFHRRVVNAVKAEERSVGATIEGFLRGTLLNWRVVLPTLGGIAVVLVIGLVLTYGHRSEVPVPTFSSAQNGMPHNSDADFRPTIANYQMVVNQSLEKLDQLLTEQGSKRLPPAPIYKASAFVTADISN